MFYTFGLKARGFLFLINFLAYLISLTLSIVFEQFLQLQVSSQNLPWVKHSQYIFRHLVLLQLQDSVFTEVDLAFSIVSYWSTLIVLCLLMVFLPSPRVFLLADVFGDTPSSCSDWRKIESLVFWNLTSGNLSCAFCSLFLINYLLVGDIWNFPVSSLLSFAEL